MHYFHAGNEKDRPFRRAPPAFVREAVGGTYFAGLPVSNQRVGLKVDSLAQLATQVSLDNKTYFCPGFKSRIEDLCLHLVQCNFLICLVNRGQNMNKPNINRTNTDKQLLIGFKKVTFLLIFHFFICYYSNTNRM